MKKILIIIVVLIILVGGGYLIFHKTNRSSNSPASTSTTAKSSDNMTNSTSGNQAAVATDQVTIKSFAFSPASIKVKKGTKVTWTNEDSTTHTVTADNSGGPSSSNLNPGDTYSFTFSQAGTFTYHCNFHSSMQGTVTVE